MVIQNTLHDGKLIESKLLQVEKKDIINNKLTIPENITIIGTNACENLVEYCKDNSIIITMPNTVRNIEPQAFQQLAIKNITFSTNIEVISKDSFASCIFEQELVLPKNLESIPAHCFYRSTFLDNVIFPEKLKEIEQDAFSFTEFFQPIKLPEKLEQIQAYAFYKSSFVKIDAPKCEIGYCSFKEQDLEYTENEQGLTIYGAYKNNSDKEYKLKK